MQTFLEAQQERCYLDRKTDIRFLMSWNSPGFFCGVCFPGVFFFVFFALLLNGLCFIFSLSKSKKYCSGICTKKTTILA